MDRDPCAEPLGNCLHISQMRIKRGVGAQGHGQTVIFPIANSGGKKLPTLKRQWNESDAPSKVQLWIHSKNINRISSHEKSFRKTLFATLAILEIEQLI